MTTQPLPRGQQLLLQRMIAFNGYSDEDAQKVFKELKRQSVTANDDDDQEDEGNDEGFMGTATTLEEAFCSINRQLTPGFGLEIVSMVDHGGSHGDKSGRPMKFHAVVNMQADDVAKASFGRSSFTDHERAYIRLCLQRLVEEESMSLKRSDLINLRSDLENGYRLQLNQAERTVQVLLEQGWLRVSTREAGDDEDGDDDDEAADDDDDDENNNNDQSPSPNKRRKKQKKKKQSGKSNKRNYRRQSVQNELELAPRAYLELSHYLTGLGLDPEDMPQFLFHRKNEE